MRRAVSSRGECLSHWQVCVCLVLIALMLYNPFAGLWGMNAGLNYDQLARNRATVGASELQHFSPVSNLATQTELDVDVPVIGLVQSLRVECPFPDFQDVFQPQAEFFNEFWNKPPPSL